MGDDADEYLRDMKRMNRRVTREDEARSRRMEADLERERSRRSAPIRREDDPLYSEKGSIGASFRKHTFGDQKPQKPLLSVFFKSDKKGAQEDLRGGGSGGSRDSRRRRGGGSGNWDDIDSSHSSSRPRPSSRYGDDDYYEEEREVRRSPRRSNRAEDEEPEVTSRTRRGGPASTRHEPQRSRMRDEQEEEVAQEEERRRERRAEAEKKAAEEGRIKRPSGRYADEEEEIEARPRRQRPSRGEYDYEEEETVTRRARPARPGGRDDVEEVSTRRKARPRRDDPNNGAEEDDEGEEVVRRRRRQRTPTRDDEVDYEGEATPRNARSPRPRAGDETVEVSRHRRARPDRADPAHDVKEEEINERRQRPASDLPPRPPRRSGGGHDEDEYAEAPRHRPRTRPPVDDYEELERVSTRSTNSSHRSAEEPPRRSRLEPDLRPPRGERVRRLKEVQTEHRKKVESDAAVEPDYYEEEEVEVNRRPEPHLPSRASRPTPAVPHRDYELSDEDEAAPSSLHGRRALETGADDAAPQFRLPQPVAHPHHTEMAPSRSLVRSAQRVSSPDEVEEEVVVKEPKKPYVRPRLGTPSGPDEEVESRRTVVTDTYGNIPPKVAPKVPQKSSIKPKPRTVLPKEEEDDDAAFLSAARSKLRGSQVSHAPKPPPSRGSRSQSPESEDDFVPPKLKPATVRKVSEAKPSEAIRKLAELRATKPVLKVEERTPEAFEQRAALRPPKPVTKASVPKPEAAEVLSRLKPRSSVSHDDTDPRAEALAAQLRQLKPRSKFQDSSDDELEPRAPSRTDSMDSVDSLHHPTKGRSKGPRRRLPTQ